MIKRIAVITIVVVLAAFFAFVGWNKAFASLSDLAKYGAWTVYLPVLPGKLVGWSEMLCALALIIPLSRFWAALILIVNQMAAAAVHLAHGELRALPQNAVLISLLIAIAIAARMEQANRHAKRSGDQVFERSISVAFRN